MLISVTEIRCVLLDLVSQNRFSSYMSLVFSSGLPSLCLASIGGHSPYPIFIYISNLYIHFIQDAVCYRYPPGRSSSAEHH